jgi:hypothetical protein
MQSTAPGERTPDPPGFFGLWVFLGLVICWAVALVLPWVTEPLAVAGPWLSRASGYLACFFMLWPYVHILRRFWRGHHGFPSFFWRVRMSMWLHVHIVSAYLAFGFLLLHCWAKMSSPLTFCLTLSVWAVMLSGVVGYYGQRGLYRAMHRFTNREVGLERYLTECEQLRTLAERGRPSNLPPALPACLPPLIKEGPEPWRPNTRQIAEKLFARLSAGPSFWDWLARGMPREELPEGEYQNVRAFLPPQEAEHLDALWGLARERAALDFEYRIHQLGRLWLLFHGPASVLLLALMAQHIWTSVWYGGW